MEAADAFECQPIDDGESFRKLFSDTVTISENKGSDVSEGLVRVGKKKYVMTVDFGKRVNLFHDMKMRPDDYVVCSMPRSGTTVTMEMVWLLANDLNFEEANKRHLSKRYCKLEDLVEVDGQLGRRAEQRFSIDIVETFPSPRFIQMHVAFSFFQSIFDAGKIVYVARNPKDVIVSAYHFLRNHKFLKYSGTMEDFVNSYTNDIIRWTPHWEHVKEAWAERRRANLMILFYEEIRSDLPGTVRRVAQFLGKNSYSDEDFAKLVDHLNITNFRRNDMVNSFAVNGQEILDTEKFIRKGVINGWKEELSEDLVKKIDEWTAKNLEGTGIVFPE